MSLYKAFFKILKKNRFAVILYLVITIGVLVMLSGIYSNNTAKKATLESYPIYIRDLDNSEYSKAVVEYLGSIHSVKENELNEDQIKDLLYYEQIVSYIVIPQGFGDSFRANGENKIHNEYDEAMPVGISISLQIENFLNSFRNYLALGDSVEEAKKKSMESLDITKYVSIHAGATRDNGQMKGAFNYIPYGILSILIMGIFPAVVAFNKGEKKNRIQVSSMAAGKRNGWILGGAATFALIVLVFLVIVASIMGSSDGVASMPGASYGSDASAAGNSLLFTNTWWLSVANAFVYTLVVSMLISMFANVPFFASAPASAFATIVGLGFCFLGGTFVPLDMLGEGVAKVGRFLPNYWYSTAVDRIYNGGTFADVWDCFAIQLAFGLVCLFVGLAVAKLTAERKQLA